MLRQEKVNLRYCVRQSPTTFLELSDDIGRPTTEYREGSMIPKNTSVLVKRVPAAKKTGRERPRHEPQQDAAAPVPASLPVSTMIGAAAWILRICKVTAPFMDCATFGGVGFSLRTGLVIEQVNKIYEDQR